MKLNLGAGHKPLDGYINLDRDTGQEIYPLYYDGGAADEIRASHVLEHFSHRDIEHVLKDWVRVLKPGGLLKIAVPDFEWIARNYLDGKDIPVQGYLFGGHEDENDRHGSAFDLELLAELLRQAGLIDIERWGSDAGDCSSLPVSLNLMGRKPVEPIAGPPPKIVAVMSTPRLGFDDNFNCAFEAIAAAGIPLRKFKGAYWEQCLERAIEMALADGADAVLTSDYDSLYTAADVRALVQLFREHPEADAVAPVQAARWHSMPMLTMNLPIGVKAEDRMPQGVFAPPLTRLKSAHFGLTLIRAAAFASMPKPWFRSEPSANGKWDENRIDADVAFWRNFEAAGFALYSANRVAIGHLELMALWPGTDLAAVVQPVSDFANNGKPKGIWQ